MSPKTKTLDPADPRVVHVFRVLAPAMGKHDTRYWKGVTCDNVYRAVGPTKDKMLDRMKALMGNDRDLRGIITYRGLCNPAEMAAQLTDIHFDWKEHRDRAEA